MITILGVNKMKHMYIVDYDDGNILRGKVDAWIGENEESILEVIDIDYSQQGNLYLAVVSYLEREEDGRLRFMNMLI